MRIRILTVVCLALASTAGLAMQPQSPIDWPPKAVPKQQKGKVPDFREKNQVCLDCHADIMDVKTRRKKIPNLHRLHLASTKTAYKGDNRDCLTCHEMVMPAESKKAKKQGWFNKGSFYHPEAMLAPAGVWRKTIVRGGEGAQYLPTQALRSADPYPFKPSLKRLVCLECHGPDSKTKTFYGAPEAAR